MAYEEIKEKVAVVAIHKDGTVFPHAFKYHNKKRKIDKVNLSYQERDGASINYYFAIESGGMIAKLKYNNISLIWTLEEVWVE